MVNKVKKGFTLIEVIISMSIMGMVMIVIYSMFFSNYKTMNTVNSGVELQSQGEKAMNYFVNTAISANTINYFVNNESTNQIKLFKKIDNLGDDIQISEISFTTVKYDKVANTVNDNQVIYSLVENLGYQPSSGNKSYNLMMKKSESDVNGVKVAQYISSVVVKPMFGSKSFSELTDTDEIGVENITGIEFILLLETGRGKELKTQTITNKVNFRN